MAINSKNKLNETRLKLTSEFRMTNLGEPKKFLGIEIEWKREKGTIFIHQKTFIESVLNRFNLTKAKTVNTPMITRDCERKIASGEVQKEINLSNIPYRQAIGCLLYLTNRTRPDIAFAVNALSRRQSNYTVVDWFQVKRVLIHCEECREC